MKTSIELPPRENTESSSEEIIRENNSNPNPCIFKPYCLHCFKFFNIFFGLFKSLVTVRAWVLSCRAHWSFIHLFSGLIILTAAWWWAAATWGCWWIILPFFLILFYLLNFFLLFCFYFVIWILFFQFFRLLRLTYWAYSITCSNTLRMGVTLGISIFIVFLYFFLFFNIILWRILIFVPFFIAFMQVLIK